MHYLPNSIQNRDSLSNNDDRAIATPSGDKFTGSIPILSRRFYLMTTNSGNEKTKAEYSDFRHVFNLILKKECFLFYT